jgi:hypothetical protein
MCLTYIQSISDVQKECFEIIENNVNANNTTLNSIQENMMISYNKIIVTNPDLYMILIKNWISTHTKKNNHNDLYFK